MRLSRSFRDLKRTRRLRARPSSPRIRSAASGSRKLAVPTATSAAPARADPGRARRSRPRPCRRPATSTAAATSATCLSAIVRTAGPESPPLPAPSQGVAAAARAAPPSAVLISETASAPPSAAATATAAGSATFGVSFTISGLRGQRPQRLHQRPRLGGLLADDQARVHVRAGDVELDRGDLVAARRPPRPSPRTPRRSSPSPRRSAAPAARRARAGRARGSPRRPLFGSPIELTIAAGSSQSRGGGLPARGAGVIVFET